MRSTALFMLPDLSAPQFDKPSNLSSTTVSNDVIIETTIAT